MKPYCLIVFMLIITCSVTAQHVGINTAAPLKLFSVNGSILVDQNNTNPGHLDSASLTFGTTGVGIFSNKTPGIVALNGIDFWTANTRRMVIGSTGLIGINLGTTSPTAFLDVNGSVRARSSLTVNTTLTVDNNSYVGGNSTVDGNLTVDGSVSVGGKGLVRSNSATNLRMGFTKGTFGITLNAGQSTDIPFLITPFSGDNDDIRVSICQFVPNAGNNDTWGRITMTVHSVNPANDQCTVRFFNGSSSAATMDGTLHLMSVATN